MAFDSEAFPGISEPSKSSEVLGFIEVEFASVWLSASNAISAIIFDRGFVDRY